MKLNKDKCHFLVSDNITEHLWTKVGDELIWESREEKLLGITIDKNLNFNSHLTTLCKKVGQKVGNTPHDTVDRVGDIADFISNPTGAPVPAPGAKQQPGAVAGVAQPPPQTQPTQGVSPEAGAAIANVQQAQVGGRAGIAQRKRQAVKAKA